MGTARSVSRQDHINRVELQNVAADMLGVHAKVSKSALSVHGDVVTCTSSSSSSSSSKVICCLSRMPSMALPLEKELTFQNMLLRFWEAPQVDALG